MPFLTILFLLTHFFFFFFAGRIDKGEPLGSLYPYGVAPATTYIGYSHGFGPMNYLSSNRPNTDSYVLSTDYSDWRQTVTKTRPPPAGGKVFGRNFESYRAPFNQLIFRLTPEFIDLFKFRVIQFQNKMNWPFLALLQMYNTLQYLPPPPKTYRMDSGCCGLADLRFWAKG